MWELWTEGTPWMPHMHIQRCSWAAFRRQILNSNTRKSTSSLPLWFGLSSTDSWNDYIIVLLLQTVPPLLRRGATIGPAADGGPACPHLRIIWTQIVYLALLKCYQCFLCAFVSPQKKKKNCPTPSPKTGSMSLWAIQGFGMTTNKIGPN